MVNDGGKAAILHKPFTLNCHVMGNVDSIHWFRNGKLISADNTTKLTADNRTLSLSPVQHSDKGHYYCQAFNYVSNMTSSSYTLQVNCKYIYTMYGIQLSGSNRIINSITSLLKNHLYSLISCRWSNGSRNNRAHHDPNRRTQDSELHKCLSSTQPHHMAHQQFPRGKRLSVGPWASNNKYERDLRMPGLQQRDKQHQHCLHNAGCLW